jgi:hypothetical protein
MNQHPDGSWSPLWFGNQDHPTEDNPVYGTAKVLMAYRDLGLMDSPEAQRGLAWLVGNQNADGGWGSGVWEKAGARGSGLGAREERVRNAERGEFGREVEDRLNARLADDVPVQVHFLPRSEALADPDLIRTKVSLIPESVDPIRVIDIVGIDKQADGGTHVAASGEVGRVRVVKTESKGKANKRIRIQLERT